MNQNKSLIIIIQKEREKGMIKTVLEKSVKEAKERERKRKNNYTVRNEFRNISI